MKNVAKNWTSYFLAGVLVLALALGAQADGRRDVVATGPGTYLATGTDALTTAVGGVSDSRRMEITWAVITTASVVNLMLTDSVGTRTLTLNGGTSCTAGVLYTQAFSVYPTWTVNLRVATATTPVFVISRETNGR